MSEKITGDLVVRKQRFAVVTSRFNDFITSRLRDAAVDTLTRHGCPESNITEVWVPGAFELPLAAQKLAASKRYDAVIALGCIIRGATTHFEHICNQAARGLAQVALETGVPVAFGVLTTNTIEQAVERAGAKSGNKGADAALTAIEMANLLNQIDTDHKL